MPEHNACVKRYMRQGLTEEEAIRRASEDPNDNAVTYGSSVETSLAAGFAQIPLPILYTLQLNQQEKILYVLLLSYSWQKGVCWPGQTALKRLLGTSERHIRRVFKSLETKGLLKIIRRGLGRTNQYVILKWPAWLEKEARALVNQRQK